MTLFNSIVVILVSTVRMLLANLTFIYFILEIIIVYGDENDGIPIDNSVLPYSNLPFRMSDGISG
jgi:hypothetical protein